MNMLSGVGATRLGGVEGSSSSVSSSLWSWWYASNSLLFTKTQKSEKRGENVYVLMKGVYNKKDSKSFPLIRGQKHLGMVMPSDTDATSMIQGTRMKLK